MRIVLIGIMMVGWIPLVFLWALNGLFGLSIEYTFVNWFYALVLLLIGALKVRFDKE